MPIQPKGSAMNSQNRIEPSERSGTVSQAFITCANGDMSRRLGNILAVTLEGSALSADKIFGTESKDQVSTETTSSKDKYDTEPWPVKVFL